MLLMSSKNQLLHHFCFPYHLPIFYFIDYCNYHYFLSSAYLGLICFFFQLLRVEAKVTDLRAFSFSNRGIFCSKCLMKNCLSGILQVLICCVFIFIQLEHFVISHWISTLSHTLFRTTQFNFQIFRDFIDIFLLLDS